MHTLSAVIETNRPQILARQPCPVSTPTVQQCHMLPAWRCSGCSLCMVTLVGRYHVVTGREHMLSFPTKSKKFGCGACNICIKCSRVINARLVVLHMLSSCLTPGMTWYALVVNKFIKDTHTSDTYVLPKEILAFANILAFTQHQQPMHSDCGAYSYNADTDIITTGIIPGPKAGLQYQPGFASVQALPSMDEYRWAGLLPTTQWALGH